MFLDICPNNKRDRATLEKMIMRRVRRGTTILTDKWGGYRFERFERFISLSKNIKHQVLVKITTEVKD